MALGIVKLDGASGRVALVAGFLVCLTGAIFFAKWSFANAASPRAAAKDVADLAVQFGPDDPQTHFAAAVLYEKTFEPQDLAHSIEEYEKTAALAPNNYISWLELGKARDRRGDADGAERSFLRALELAPNYADVQWAYGNSLLRAGRTEEGFTQIRTAATAKPEYMGPAAVTAMTMLDGDAATVRDMLGNSGAVNAALATYALSGKHYAEAASAWDMIPADEKLPKFREAGQALLSQLAGAKQYRLAARIAKDIWDADGTGPGVGSVLNGGFETGIRLNEARLFDWQVGNGIQPQIGLSGEQKHGGAYSLYMAFNTMLAADLRQVSQTVAVESGKSYTFGGSYRAEIKGSLAWDVVDASDGKNLAKTPPVQSTDGWTSFRVNFNAPPGSDGVIIRLVRDGCEASVCPITGKVWFDDFSLSQQSISVDQQ